MTEWDRRAGEFSARFIIWAFRWITTPWLHLVIVLAAALLTIYRIKQGDIIRVIAPAWAVICFSTTGIVSVLVRREMTRNG